jgi:predicted outer membrane repeat protein
VQLRYSTMESFNSTYFNNSAFHGGMVHINTKSSVTFDHDRFQKNIATGDGALVHGLNFGELSFSHVEIDASNTFSYTHATLVYLIDGVFDIQSCFFGNPQNTTRSTTLDLKHLVFNMNNTDFNNFYGNEVGGIVRVLEGVETNINGCTFSNNAAEKFGGALAFSHSKNVSVTNCKFFNNIAISGGAIYAEDSSLLVANSVFERNIAYLGEC